MYVFAKYSSFKLCWLVCKDYIQEDPQSTATHTEIDKPAICASSYTVGCLYDVKQGHKILSLVWQCS